jgi:large subunit ribosomal protein L21
MATAKKTTKKAASTGTFAVIATGGKQYLVKAGDIISVEKLEGTFTAGDTITFDEVLLKDDGASTIIGTPMIKGAVVTAEFVAAGRGQKIDVIQYKQKSRYFKKKGHRQPFMKFKISDIK